MWVLGGGLYVGVGHEETAELGVGHGGSRLRGLADGYTMQQCE